MSIVRNKAVSRQVPRLMSDTEWRDHDFVSPVSVDQIILTPAQADGNEVARAAIEPMTP